MNDRFDKVNEQITLHQLNSGLTFGTDAFLLAAYLRAKPRCQAVELGCGTGIVSLLCMSRQKFHSIIATEIQSTYVEITKENVRNNNFENSIQTIGIDIRDLNLSHIGKEVDVVFSNPPYMKTEAGNRNAQDEKFIARHEVCGTIDDFCSCASRLLKTGGLFTCVYRPDRLSDLMSSMKKHRLEPKRMTFVHSDTHTPPSIVLIEAMKDGSVGLKVSNPLILYADDHHVSPRKYTEEAQLVYDTCRLGY